MFLPPSEIRQQTLKERFGGYDRGDVDRLLEVTVASYEQVWQERDEACGRADRFEEELARFRELEHTLQDALVTAQRAGEQVLEDAKKRSDEVLAGARRQAGDIVEDAERRNVELSERIEHLETLEQEIQLRYRAFLAAGLKLLDDQSGAGSRPLVDDLSDSAKAAAANQERGEPGDDEARAREGASPSASSDLKT